MVKLKKMIGVGVICTVLAGVQAGHAKENVRDTFCNPLNLEYSFWDNFREAADPVIVTYQNEYYLFASHSMGYWWSTDLKNWNLVKVSTGQLKTIVQYAPTVMVIGDTMYYMAHHGDLYKTTSPKTAEWSKVGKVKDVGDPCLFADDDGRVYLYWGLVEQSIYGVELDPDNNFAVKGEEVVCVTSKEKKEGPWMVKYKGRYYLQYAVPATASPNYRDQCYVSDSPLGPFTERLPTSPVSLKPKGFVTGVGHSCTFKDLQGKYWHVTSTYLSKIYRFERRLSLFPAFFDVNDDFYVDTYRGDYPQYAPGKAPDGVSGNVLDLRLLSKNRPVSASSTMGTYGATNAVDESIRSWWCAETGDVGEWLSVDLEAPCDIQAIQVNFAEQDLKKNLRRKHDFSHKYTVEGALNSNGPWSVIIDKSENMKDVPHDYVPLEESVNARYLRVTNAGSVPGFSNFAIRALRVFGSAPGNAPEAVNEFKAKRYKDSDMCNVQWEPVPNAEGYIVRYGHAPDKLYRDYETDKDATSIKINIRNKEVEPYYLAVDAFNRSGLTRGTVVKTDQNEKIER